MTLYPFINGPFHGQTLVVDMIETTRGPVAPEEVRLEEVRTDYGKVGRVLEPGAEGGEVYALKGGEYIWKEQEHGND